VTPDLATARRFLAAKGPPGALAVGVTGAHYYGFPSPDSDLDLKGVHVGDTSEVVSLRPPPDAIDYLGVFEGMEIDYTSHELAVALRLLLKGNGNILERILSPFQLIDSETVTELQALARGAVSQKFFHHYRGFFGRMCQDWRAAEPRTVKGLLYAYRSALTGIHLLRTGECIGDVTHLAPIYGFEQVADLVALKRRSPEHGALGATAGSDADLERLETLLLAAHTESPLPPECPNIEALNGFLIRMRRSHFTGCPVDNSQPP
jgi:predicted nucleotidyltransferase